MDKKELRREIKAAVKSCDDKDLQSVIVGKYVSDLPEFKRAKCVFVYISDENEISATPIIRACFGEGKRVCIPKITGDGIMVAVEFDGYGSSLTPDKYGIPTVKDGVLVESHEIDLCIAPGVAFDLSGGRLGRGGGYYDRFLSGLSCFKLGICLNEQIVECVPRDEHDVVMDKVISAKRYDLR